jgi:hypothetical protein
MLTGSFASAFHGAPRTTQDIDIVIASKLGTLKALLKHFPVSGNARSRWSLGCTTRSAGR